MISHHLRRANALGLPLLEQLLKLTNDASRGDLRDDGNPGGSTFQMLIEDRLSGLYFPRDCWVILTYDAGEIVAWCMLSRVESSPARSGWSTGNLSIYVRPDRRKQGLAQGLIQEASKAARKKAMRAMVANPWNESSRTCFTRAGFVDNAGDDRWVGKVRLELDDRPDQV